MRRRALFLLLAAAATAAEFESISMETAEETTSSSLGLSIPLSSGRGPRSLKDLLLLDTAFTFSSSLTLIGSLGMASTLLGSPFEEGSGLGSHFRGLAFWQALFFSQTSPLKLVVTFLVSVRPLRRYFMDGGAGGPLEGPLK